MKQTVNNSADEILEKFENLESLQAGNTWEQQLYVRVASSGSGKVNRNSQVRYALLIGALLVLNASFFLTEQKVNNSRTEQRAEILNAVSNQLLILKPDSK